MNMKWITAAGLVLFVATAQAGLFDGWGEDKPEEGQQQTQTTEGAQSESMSKQFESLDTNKDGRISQTEAARDNTINAAFSALDTNRDGQLSAEEFARMSGGEVKEQGK